MERIFSATDRSNLNFNFPRNSLTVADLERLRRVGQLPNFYKLADSFNAPDFYLTDNTILDWLASNYSIIARHSPLGIHPVGSILNGCERYVHSNSDTFRSSAQNLFNAIHFNMVESYRNDPHLSLRVQERFEKMHEYDFLEPQKLKYMLLGLAAYLKTYPSLDEEMIKTVIYGVQQLSTKRSDFLEWNETKPLLSLLAIHVSLKMAVDHLPASITG